MLSLPTLLMVGAAFWIVAASSGPANLSNAALFSLAGFAPNRSAFSR